MSRGLAVVCSGWCLLAGVVMAAGFGPQRPPAARAVPVAGYQVVRTFPHDPAAFTQGLVYADGFLYEGTGLNGQSTIRKVKLDNGEVLQVQTLDARYFGEGIALWGKSLVQLTWQNGIGFVYDRTTFQRTRTFTYTGEGWGLTQDGTRLIMSDGTEYLRFLEPATMKQTGRLRVHEGGRAVINLNELEVVKGEILANVWQSDRVARISPKTGEILGWIDFAGLLTPREARDVDVMNGIAYDAAQDRLFVTGKLWPKIFQVRVVSR